MRPVSLSSSRLRDVDGAIVVGHEISEEVVDPSAVGGSGGDEGGGDDSDDADVRGQLPTAVDG